jgi:hypothetical protein
MAHRLPFVSTHGRWLSVLLLCLPAALPACASEPIAAGPVTWRATASTRDGGVPDASTLARARDIVAARLRGEDLPPTRVDAEGNRTLLIQLAWEDDFGWEVAQRLLPGELLVRPVRRQAIEPAELRDVPPRDQPRPEQVASMTPETQFGSATPTCAWLLVRVPADTADPSKPIASCRRDHTLTATKYLLGPALAGEQDITAVACTRRPDTSTELTFSLTAHGRARVRAATGALAIVLDGVVLAAIDPASGDDRLMIRDYFMGSQVAILCAQPRYASLPVVLKPEFAQ